MKKLVLLALLVLTTACASTPVQKNMTETPRTPAERFVVDVVSWNHLKANAEGWIRSETPGAASDPNAKAKLTAMRRIYQAVVNGDAALKHNGQYVAQCTQDLPQIDVDDGAGGTKQVPDATDANLAATPSCVTASSNYSTIEAGTQLIQNTLLQYGIIEAAIIQ